MKKKISLISFSIIAMFLFSCGNKDAKSCSGDAAATGNAESADAVETETYKVAAEEIILSFTLVDDPCNSNNPDFLHIMGGKPFDDEANPYKVEAKNTDKASVTLGKFTKTENNIYTMEIPETTSFADDEVAIKIVVTDADGTEKTIEYVIPHCM